jgi:RNA polymerase sigma-70 factor (ECF subfamily)
MRGADRRADRLVVGRPEEFAALLDRARGGDRDALGLLWRRWNPAVVRYLRGRRVPDAQDVASCTWIDVGRGLSRFAGDEADFRRWLFTIAHRRATDAARRRRPELGADDAELRPAMTAGPEEEVVGDAQLREALRLISQLPRDQADVVLLRVLGGLDVAAVADIVGKSPGHVRVLAHRGLARLAKMLPSNGEIGPGPGPAVTPPGPAAMKATT